MENVKKCAVARNMTVDGIQYKVVNPKDPCYAVNKVLAKHEGAQLITPEQYQEIHATKPC